MNSGKGKHKYPYILHERKTGEEHTLQGQVIFWIHNLERNQVEFIKIIKEMIRKKTIRTEQDLDFAIHTLIKQEEKFHGAVVSYVDHGEDLYA